MEFSINVHEVVNMALDTVNGNLNFHFLKRLLEAFVIHTGLNKYEMNFTGQDALRAQQVWSGCPDPNENPLNNTFSIKPNILINQPDDELSKRIKIDNENIAPEYMDDKLQGNDSIGETLKLKIPSINKILQTEVDRIEYGGTLNLNFLKQIEKLINEKSLVSANKIRRTDYGENESRKSTDLVVKELESFMSRNSSTTDSGRSKGLSRFQKKVHVKSSPSNVFTQKELPINEIISSKIRENINVGSAKSITLLDGTVCDQSSLSIKTNEIESSDTFSSYMINRHTSYSATEKYILTNHQPNALLKHIEKLLGRMNKVEHEIQMLMEKENNLSESKSSSDTSSEDDNVEPNTSHYDSFDLRESPMQEVKLKTLGKNEVTKFQRVFGLTQKKKDLDSYLSVRNFRSFFEDYTEKFRIIHDFITFHNERIMTNRFAIQEYLKKKVNIFEYESFKNTMILTCNEIKKNIKEYILKDSEAAGIVQFVKGVTCVSCDNPVVMKTTYKPKKHPKKDVFLPTSKLKTHLTYELDRVKKQYNRIPGTRDQNLILCKCKEPSTRKCSGKKIMKRSFVPQMVEDDNI